METIKKYRDVHPEDQLINFAIKRMEDIYDLEGGKPDDPHRHDYFTLILVKKANGHHIIDFNTFDLGPGQIYFISPGQVHQIIENEKSYGLAMTFTREFLVQNGIEICFIEDLLLFQDFGYSPPLVPDGSEFEIIQELGEEIFHFYHSDKKFKDQAIGALLKLFLIHCNNSCRLPQEENTQTVQASVSLLRNFKGLLEKQYASWRKVAEYAKALHITSDYLNASVKSLTGKTAKEHIQNRITLAAKRMLMFSDATTKEIAYKLGFSEPANFSQFFKKCTGLSPTGFRKSV